VWLGLADTISTRWKADIVVTNNLEGIVRIVWGK